MGFQTWPDVPAVFACEPDESCGAWLDAETPVPTVPAPREAARYCQDVDCPAYGCELVDGLCPASAAAAGVAVVQVVFDMEADTMPQVLGGYLGHRGEGEYVAYTGEAGAVLHAPADCVKIVAVRVTL